MASIRYDCHVLLGYWPHTSGPLLWVNLRRRCCHLQVFEMSCRKKKKKSCVCSSSSVLQTCTHFVSVLNRSCLTCTWGILKVCPRVIFVLNHFDLVLIYDITYPRSVCVVLISVRCKRPRTVSQKQHHTHPVHPWQRSSHPQGEKFSVFSNVSFAFKQSDQTRPLSLDHMTWALTQSMNQSVRFFREKCHAASRTVCSPRVNKQCAGEFLTRDCWSIMKECQSAAARWVSVLSCVGLRVGSGSCLNQRGLCSLTTLLFFLHSVLDLKFL